MDLLYVQEDLVHGGIRNGLAAAPVKVVDHVQEVNSKDLDM